MYKEFLSRLYAEIFSNQATLGNLKFIPPT